MRSKILAVFLTIISLGLTGITAIPNAKAQDYPGRDYDHRDFRSYYYRDYYDYRSSRDYPYYDRGARRVVIVIDNHRFMPRTIVVPRHTRVVWINYDYAQHTVTGRYGFFDSGRLNRGERYSVMFDHRGSFNYYCRIHPYMRGTIIVR